MRPLACSAAPVGCLIRLVGSWPDLSWTSVHHPMHCANSEVWLSNSAEFSVACTQNPGMCSLASLSRLFQS